MHKNYNFEQNITILSDIYVCMNVCLYIYMYMCVYMYIYTYM